MTKTTQKYLNFITDFILEYGHSPSLRQIGKKLSRSPQTVKEAVDRLVRDGHLVKCKCHPNCPALKLVGYKKDNKIEINTVHSRPLMRESVGR